MERGSPLRGSVRVVQVDSEPAFDEGMTRLYSERGSRSWPPSHGLEHFLASPAGDLIMKVVDGLITAKSPVETDSTPMNLARRLKFPAAHPDAFINRRYSRSSVEIRVEVSLFRLDGSSFDTGTGIVRDLSYSGLNLEEVVLSNGRLLADYFIVELRPAKEPPGSAPLCGRILRSTTWGEPRFGIEFLRPEAGAEQRLLAAS